MSDEGDAYVEEQAKHRELGLTGHTAGR